MCLSQEKQFFFQRKDTERHREGVERKNRRTEERKRKGSMKRDKKHGGIRKERRKRNIKDIIQ